MGRMHARRTARRALPTLVLAAGLALVALGVARLDPQATMSSAIDRSPQPLGARAPLGRLYAPSSPFNRPIPANARLDPRSDQLVHGLAEAVRDGRFVIAVGRWTVPAYVAGPRTPRYHVELTASWAPFHELADVPIPAAARPDPAGDGHLAILDRRAGCEYDFWQARKRGRTWSAAWANSVRTGRSGIYPRGLSARGSGFALLAGVIRPEELARGRIDHALIFSYPHTSAAGFVAPATESDGTSVRPDAIPEGARLQLDPSFQVRSLPRYQRIVARALQRYGMYLADTGRNVSLYAVNPQSYAADPYAGLLPDGPYADVAAIPIGRFRVLEHGPVTLTPDPATVPNGCGTFR